MNTVTLQLRRYHELLDCERFKREQDSVLIQDLSETQAIIISKDDAFKILEDTNNELFLEIDKLKGKIDELQSKVDDQTLRKQLESKERIDAQLSADLIHCKENADRLRAELNSLKNASFWEKVKNLFN